MIKLRTWKIITCIADLAIFVLFVVQVVVVVKGSIKDQVVKYSIKYSTIDIVVSLYCTAYPFNSCTGIYHVASVGGNDCVYISKIKSTIPRNSMDNIAQYFLNEHFISFLNYLCFFLGDCFD